MWKLVEIVPNVRFWSSSNGYYYSYGFKLSRIDNSKEIIINEATFGKFKDENLLV